MPSPTSPAPPMHRRHTAPDENKVTKKTSPRNTKAWTLEDERALLQGRLERIPYKQIGARIGKTDLACRLHFHQMVMAKKTPETAPGRSIVFLSSEHPPEVHRLAPPHSALSASMALSSVCGPNNSSASGLGEGGNDYREPLHRRSYSSPRTNHLGNHFEGWQPMTSPYTGSQSQQQSPNAVDLGRLHNIYRAHAGDFWSNIAAKYSGGVSPSPSQLEKAFLQARPAEEAVGSSPNLSLTSNELPEIVFTSSDNSPNLTQYRSLRHVRSASDVTIAGRCSVDSLLNHGGV